MAERSDPDRPAEESGPAEEPLAGQDVQSSDHAPEAPVLAAPQEEALVSGEQVTLRWEPVEGADGYLVEVAEDTGFHEVIVQEEVEGTAFTLPEALPTEGDLYYWRVLTHRAGRWSHGDHIESFVSVSAERAREDDGKTQAPNRSEGYGPAPALFSSAGTEAAAEATGSEAMLARERERGVAHEGIEAGQIMGFAGAVVVAVILIVCVLLFWITSVAQTERAEATDAAAYPRLMENEAQAAQQLRQYELISERDSAYRIPIEEAMRIVADEAYEQGRRYSAEVPIGAAQAPTALAGSVDAGAFVPAPSMPEGPADTQSRDRSQGRTDVGGLPGEDPPSANQMQ